MAVAYRSSTSTSYISETNTTITAPAGLQDGDTLIAAIFVGSGSGAPVVTPPAGFAALPGSPTSVTDTGFNGNFNLYWKRASGESGSYLFTHAVASSQALLFAVSGAAPSGSPIDTQSSNTGAGTTTTALGVTTTAANDLLLYIAHDWTGSGTLSPPAGFTERFDGLVYGATAVQASAGASGSALQTNGNGGPNPWAAWLVAITSQAAASGSARQSRIGLGITISLI